MQWTSVLAIYFLFFVFSAFVLLPFGVRTHDEAGVEKIPGQADSAPVEFRAGRLLLRAAILALVVTAFAVGTMFASKLAGWVFSTRKAKALGRHKPIKDTPYECGIPPEPYAWSQIQIRYYVFAILFLIFDVEAVFLFPWAVIFMQQKTEYANVVPFYSMMLFLGVLFFAIIYAWKKGVLEWRK